MPQSDDRIRIVIPSAPAPTIVLNAADRLLDLSGKRIAYLDNSKHNADRLLSEIESLLHARHATGAAVSYRKRLTSALPFDDAVYDTVAEQCHAVITAIGD